MSTKIYSYSINDSFATSARVNYSLPMAKLVLDRILKKRKITKYRFAKLLGVPTPSVFRFFRPNYDPKLSTLERWAGVLEVKIKDLYEESGP